MPTIPADVTAATADSPPARAAFQALPRSHRREYLEWIAEAKTPDTRRRRIETVLKMVTGAASG